MRSSGIVAAVYHVEYRYKHAHLLASPSNTGARQQSAAIKATIKSLLQSGSSVVQAMRTLTMDYDSFTQAKHGKRQLSRDSIITYEDVYNIWYQMMKKDMWKNDNPVISSMKWMEQLESEHSFTYYDRKDTVSGIYFGFATRWQLEQLRGHGQTLCFDGTHKVFG
jgi:hypothetical protein